MDTTVTTPDLHVPDCPACGDPLTSGCRPASGFCQADDDPPWDDMHPSDRANYLASRAAGDPS
jgi:hypothetical protein